MDKSTNEFRVMPGTICRYIIEVRIKGERNWRLFDVCESSEKANKIIRDAKSARIGEVR